MELFDANQIRKAASQSIGRGAITEDYSLDPERVCQVLNEALATEVLCMLRYWNHQITAKGIMAPQIAAEFAEHAEEEEKHAHKLAVRIDQLGGIPELAPAAVAKNAQTLYQTADTLEELIQINLVAERMVIEMYRKMINWVGGQDPTTRRVLEEILADEEEHASDLANLLGGNKKAGATLRRSA